MAPSQHPPFDRRTQDVGNIVEFGHLNVQVPDQQMAVVFYVMGLGLTRDPYVRVGVDNAWINVGTSQFHLPVGPAQVLPGVVGLVLPDLLALQSRLTAVAGLLAGTRFDFHADARQVEIICPWGNRIRAHAPEPARFGGLRLGMPYVEVRVAPDTAEPIARFYAELLGAVTELGLDANSRYARVTAGPDESLVFRETVEPPAVYDGHHVQITVADFSGVHGRLRARGLISEESNPSQYRFRDIVDPTTGKLLLRLEHEVRSMRHPMYGRQLVNREPAVDGQGYAAGHESAMWRLPVS